ncbi:MAG: hypothetical protein Q9169_007275 [Polycauliona sp. 2 TL-2023]
MTARVDSRKSFITSLGNFMKQHGFQGVDLDWEYPSATDHVGSANDAANFVALVREMRVAWNKNYGMSVTLPPDSYLGGFNAKGMEQHVDFFNYLSYDLLRDKINAGKPTAPSSTSFSTDVREIEKAAAALWTAKLDPKKVNLGLSKAGRGFTLSDPRKCSHSKCPVSGKSKPGPCTNELGLMSNVEINDVIKARGLKAQLDPASMSKEISWDDQWIGYDDDETFKMKTDWAAENCFGGTTLFSLDLDSGEGRQVDIGKMPDGGVIVVAPPAGSISSAVAGKSTTSAKPGQPIVPVLPIQPAPGKSPSPASVSGSSSTRAAQQTRSTQSSKPVSSSTALTSTAAGQTPAAAAPLVIPGIATIPAPTMAPDSMVVAGAVAVSGLVAAGVAAQKGLSEGQKAMTNLAKSDSPKSDDVMLALGTLGAAYASMQVLDKQARMLDIKTLPGDTKPFIEKFKTSLPSMISGTRDTITHLTNSMKNPARINKDDIKKADRIMGEQGSVFKQIVPVIKPLLDWKIPKGFNDIILPGILTLPSPTLGDKWTGTVIPNTLSVPSPSTPWDAALLLFVGAKGAAGAAGSSSGGGGAGGLLASLLNLAKQAEGAVKGAADAMNVLSTLCKRDAFSCPISFLKKLPNTMSQLLAATEDVGGLGAGLDAIELDAFPPADISRVVSVQNANRNLFNVLKGTLSDLANIITHPPAALQLLKKNSPAYVAGGAVLTLLSKTNGGSIGALPWNAVGAKKGRNEYFMVTVPNTPVKVFHDFIRKLPDKGAGPQRLYDWPRQYQTYVGKLTRKEAEAVNTASIIAVISGNRIRVVGEPMAIEGEPAGKDRMLSRSALRSNGTRLESRMDPLLLSTTTLRGISPGEGVENGPNGMYDVGPPVLGRPSTAAPGEEVEGDVLAALAIGNTVGVANKATLVAVQADGLRGEETIAEAYEAWRWIVSDVQTKNRQRKAVTSYSKSWEYSETFANNQHVDYNTWSLDRPDQGDSFLPLLVDLWLANIITVFGAGQLPPMIQRRPTGGLSNLGYWTPQRFANDKNGLIVVGHVTRGGAHPRDARSGTNWIRNRDVGPAYPMARDNTDQTLVGEITLYALGESVDIIDGSDDRGFKRAAGNILTAPQIAGLAAYYLTLPGFSWPPDLSFFFKRWLKDHTRRPPVSPDGHDVAHNNAYEYLRLCQEGNDDGLVTPPAGEERRPPQRRRWTIKLETVSNLIRGIFNRQENVRETVIFEKGRLTDPKYSNQCWGGYQPIYQPDTLLPIINETCFSEKFKGKSISFHETDMASFINETCTTSKSFPFRPSKPAKSDKGVNLSLAAANVTKPVEYKQQDCLTGFYLALNNCDEEQPDKIYGGSLQVGDVQYFVYAEKASAPPKSSSEVPKPSPPPAPPKPSPQPPPPKGTVCNAKYNSKYPFFHDFDPRDMYALINRTCSSRPSKTNSQVDAFSIRNNGEVSLEMQSSGREMKPPWDRECIHGFTTAVDSCDQDSDKHYGGTVELDKVKFAVGARTVDTKPKDCHCTPKFSLPFKKPDMVNWIRDFCGNTNAFDIDVIIPRDEPGNKPLAEFHVHPKKAKMVIGFDKGFCTKGFQAAVDHCNKVKDKDQNTADLWGGECRLNDIVFQATAPLLRPKKPDDKSKDKPKGKPPNDQDFGKDGDLGLGDGDGGKK